MFKIATLNSLFLVTMATANFESITQELYRGDFGFNVADIEQKLILEGLSGNVFSGIRVLDTPESNYNVQNGKAIVYMIQNGGWDQLTTTQ